MASFGPSEPARGQQPGQFWFDAGESLLRVGSGSAENDAEGADGGERLPGVLRLGEVIAVVRDDERVAQVTGKGACAFGEAPQLEHERAETRELGLRPLARPRGRVRLTGARLPPRPRSDR